MGFNLGTSGNSNKLSMTDFLGGANSAAPAAEKEIDINSLVPWENQPFKMYSEFKLNELANSIKENGLLSPIIVCPIKDDEGKYRIIAGHNRVEACRKIGMTSIPSVVKDVDENHAKLMMADTNLCQRTELLPSERAYAYRAQQEALQALGSKRATAEIADNYDEDRRTIQRYISCARLCPELMDMLDSGRLIFAAAVKLSGLNPKVQETIGLVLEDKSKLKISADQANELVNELGDMQYVTSKKILELLSPRKSAEKNAPAAKITLSRKEVTEIIGEDMSNDDISEFFYFCLQHEELLDEWRQLAEAESDPDNYDESDDNEM